MHYEPYLDYTVTEPIERFVYLKNGYKLWTRRSGTGGIPVLLVHGGPGGTSTMLKPVEIFFQSQGLDTIVYHQLDSLHSDRPNDARLWTIEQFTQHLEEVCDALNLQQFYLFCYSWGVVLGIEYALRHPARLRGLVLSNFTASAASFQAYFQELRCSLKPESQRMLAALEAEEDFDNPVWGTIIREDFIPKHFCRLSPLPATFNSFLGELNWHVCQHFFGKNDFVVQGAFAGWDRWTDLPRVLVPTLVISGQYDQSSPADTMRMAKLLPRGIGHIVPDASHVPFYEQPADYCATLKRFLETTQ